MKLCRKIENTNDEDNINDELKRSINRDEQKKCYLKFLLKPEYEFSDDDSENFINLCHRNDYYIKEELQENIGRKFIHNVSILEKELPTYIIFYNKDCKPKNKNIESSIEKNSLMNRQSLKIFRNYEQFKNFVSSLYTNEFQVKYIGINIYDTEINHRSIYKKLQVKYDFFYVELKDYEIVKGKIDFFKNKQLLELLGAKTIIIDRNHLKNNILSIMLGNGNVGLEASNTDKSEESKKDIYEYKLTKGFYSSVEDFMEKVDSDKYILLSRDDIERDFELKSLIGSRIEKGLNEFNKIIRINTISKKEMKLNMIFNSSMGIKGRGKVNANSENYLKIYCLFFEIENLYNVDEIPLTYEGFKILSSIQNGERKKFIENFYLRALKKSNCLGMHLSKLENQEQENNGDHYPIYNNAVKNISSYFQIQNLIQSLTDPNDLKLNEEGFNTMRIVCSQDLDHGKRKFFKRFLSYNGIDMGVFEVFITDVKKMRITDFIHNKLRNYKHLLKYTEEFKRHPKYASADESGFYYFTKYNKSLIDSTQRTNLITYMNNYSNVHYRIPGFDVSIYISALSTKKIFLINNIDYELFKLMMEHIIGLNGYEFNPSPIIITRGTPYNSEIRATSSPLVYSEINKNQLPYFAI